MRRRVYSGGGTGAAVGAAVAAGDCGSFCVSTPACRQLRTIIGGERSANNRKVSNEGDDSRGTAIPTDLQPPVDTFGMEHMLARHDAAVFICRVVFEADLSRKQVSVSSRYPLHSCFRLQLSEFPGFHSRDNAPRNSHESCLQPSTAGRRSL